MPPNLREQPARGMAASRAARRVPAAGKMARRSLACRWRGRRTGARHRSRGTSTASGNPTIAWRRGRRPRTRRSAPFFRYATRVWPPPGRHQLVW